MTVHGTRVTFSIDRRSAGPMPSSRRHHRRRLRRARRRARARGAAVRVTLIDRHNYHLFQPLLYQVATASLSPGDVASPIRWILRHQQNVQVLLAEARGDRSRHARRVLTLRSTAHASPTTT